MHLSTYEAHTEAMMTADECRDKIRFSLSDKSGSLRFESFEITGALYCQDIADELRRMIISRSLDEIDIAQIRRLRCPGSGQCMRAIADVVAELQQVFAHTASQP